MSLIPAKDYYGEDTSVGFLPCSSMRVQWILILVQDQWQRKKQTKEQKRAARKAKLDPANQKSAKDVMDENERKRKREMGIDDEDPSDVDAPGKEKPGEGTKRGKKTNKKQKLEQSEEGAPDPEQHEEDWEDEEEAEQMMDKQKRKVEKRREKAQRKKEKVAKKKEKAEVKKVKRREAKAPSEPANADDMENDAQLDARQDPVDSMDIVGFDTEEIGDIDITGMEDKDQEASSASQSPAPVSPCSAESAQPSASSSSSIQHPATVNDTSKSENPDRIFLPKIDHETLQARLRAHIEAARAARKADGPDGKPARNRTELLEARRRKDEQRKAQKKEQRKQSKEAEARAKAEEELARLRGSGSPSTPDIFSPHSPPDNTFSFGRVNFADGQQLDSRLSGLVDPKKRKGSQDPRTALQAAQKKHARLSGLDDEKKADIEEKDMWLNAKKRVHGERVKDDMSLLKKTLKRKQKAKEKSERQWNERIEGVVKGKEMRQKKREANIQKRREEKSGKSKAKKPMKKKGRPGFEGSFRSSTKMEAK